MYSRFLFISIAVVIAVMNPLQVGAASLGVDVPAEPLNKDAAYVLVELNARGTRHRLVSSLNLLDSNTGSQIVIPKRPGLQLIRVPAGKFRPHSIGLFGPNGKVGKKHLDSEHTANGIVLEAGTVTYVGRWYLRYGKSILVDGIHYAIDDAGFGIRFDAEQIRETVASNAAITALPLRIAHINGRRIAVTPEPAARYLAARSK